MHYQFIPVWKDNSRRRGGRFIGDNSIIFTKFKSIYDGLAAAKIDGTCLREQNWNIFECTFFGLIKKRIMLESLHKQGYLGDIEEDKISKVYRFGE